MQTNMRLLFSVAGLLGVIALASPVRSEPPKDPNRPVSLQDVQQRGIEGELGVRLGTIVEVSGVVVANSSNSKADASVPFFLSITSVDGHALPKPVLYPFVSTKLKAPKIGDKFRYVGYESGEFTGAPKGLFDYEPAYATTGFGFTTKLYVIVAK